MIDIHALGLLLGIETCKGAKWVVADHQCLPASHVEGALPLEGSMHSSVKNTNKSLQLIHSVLHTSGVLGIPMMNRNTGNMKNTHSSHTMS